MVVEKMPVWVLPHHLWVLPLHPMGDPTSPVCAPPSPEGAPTSPAGVPTFPVNSGFNCGLDLRRLLVRKILGEKILLQSKSHAVRMACYGGTQPRCVMTEIKWSQDNSVFGLLRPGRGP